MTGDVLRHEAPGDMRAGAHFVPLDPGRHHVGFSIQPGVQIPTGTAAGFFTAGLWQALVELGLEVRVGPLRVLGSAATEIGFARVEEGIELIPRMVYGAGFELRPVPEWSVAATYAGRVHSFDTWDIPMEIRVGTAVRPEGALVIGGFVGFGVRTGPGTPALRAGGEITVPIRAPARANPNTLVGMLQQASSPAPQGEPAADDPEPP